MAEHASHDHAAHADHGGEAHVHHYDYPRIWAILVALLVVSVLGPMLGIKIITLITAFGIALVKAYMVVKYFMHLDVQQPFVHYFLATALAFMVLFFAAVSPDVMNHDGTRWENVAAKEATARVEAMEAAGGGEHGAHGEH